MFGNAVRRGVQKRYLTRLLFAVSKTVLNNAAHYREKKKLVAVLITVGRVTMLSTAAHRSEHSPNTAACVSRITLLTLLLNVVMLITVARSTVFNVAAHGRANTILSLLLVVTLLITVGRSAILNTTAYRRTYNYPDTDAHRSSADHRRTISQIQHCCSP